MIALVIAPADSLDAQDDVVRVASDNSGASSRVFLLREPGRGATALSGGAGPRTAEASRLIGAATDRPSRSLLEWTKGATAPLPRFEAQGLAVNGLLYVFGGFFADVRHPVATSEVHFYDPAADRWMPLADMPEPLTHAGQAADGPTIYLAGGFLGDYPGPSTDHVWAYNTATDKWSAGPSLPADRGGGGLVRLGRNLHYFGGATNPSGKKQMRDFDDHWVLGLGPTNSPADDDRSWKIAAPMPNPRNHLAAAALNGLAYAIGGQHTNDERMGNQASTHAYDPESDTWTPVADLPEPVGHIAAAAFAVNDKIVVAGGVTNHGKTAAVVAYDPASDTWFALPELPEPRQSPVAAIIDNQIIVTGGLFRDIETTTWLASLR